MVAINAGTKLKGFVLFLCSYPPAFFLILLPFSLIKLAISYTDILSTPLNVIIAKSLPPYISTRQLTSTLSYGTN